jgi:acyl dehydratase
MIGSAQARAAPDVAGKAHRFELVEIPEHFGPREILVDEQRVKNHAFAQDDYDPSHFLASPFGGPVAHAALLANELMQIYFERYRIDVHEKASGTWLEEAHVEETLWFESPVFVGERVEVSGRFVDKYVRGGRGAVVLEGEARASDGRLIMGHRAIEYFAMESASEDSSPRLAEKPMRRVQREPGGEDEAVGSARPGIAPGTPITALVKTISFPQQLVFSTLEHPNAQRSVHTDLEIARRAGLAGPLVQGQQIACHISEAMTRFFGSAWYSSGRVQIKFLAAVCAGETITVAGKVRADGPRGGEERLDLDLWVQDSTGLLVAVANASAAATGAQEGSEGPAGGRSRSPVDGPADRA